MKNALFAGKISGIVFPSLLVSLAAAAVLVFAAPAFGATAPAPCEPQVSQSSPNAYWASYSDYLQERLTVDESLQNIGGCNACRLRIAQVEATQGVTLQTPLPVDLGDVPPAASGLLRLQFKVPQGVASFRSRLRAVCDPTQLPVSAEQLSVDPPVAWANQDCPVQPPEMNGFELPTDLSYGPKLFTATLKDAGGNAIAGKAVKWRLTDPIGFRIVESTSVTDSRGQATALVAPPLYFVCIVPYFDKGMTEVSATTDDGLAAGATFVYSRCAPPGANPPWAGASSASSGA